MINNKTQALRTIGPSATLQLPDSLGGLACRLLGRAHIAELVALRELVLADLGHPDAYVREEDELGFVSDHCGQAGQTIGLFHGEQLIAYAMLGLPSAQSADNLGRLLAFEPDQLAQVAHIASCMVLPAFRGRGLQRSLLTIRYALAESFGRHHCLAMVSLINHPSRHNMLTQGMSIRWTGELAELRRQVLHVSLTRETSLRSTDGEWIDSNDWGGQRRSLDNGRWGIRDERRLGGVSIYFA